MNNISYSGTSQTISTKFMTALIIGSTLTAYHSLPNEKIIRPENNFFSISNNTNRGYTPLSGIQDSQNFVSQHNNNNFINQISTFYESLITRQEVLGECFEKILFDNLWDLYD